jgi:hypothetical protein
MFVDAAYNISWKPGERVPLQLTGSPLDGTLISFFTYGNLISASIATKPTKQHESLNL